jgi:uncharacterized SAM-binding protein YcdF (DUF218 family)
VDGIFSVTVSLTPGLYQYKYIVNGNWCHNPLEPSLSTPEGYINNWLRVVSPSQEKVIIVLGEKLLDNGGPSTILESRITTTCDYIKSHPEVKLVLFTGGKVSSGYHKSEAEVMNDLATAKGLTLETIIEDQASNTFANAFYSRDILKERFKGEEFNIILITSDFHLVRALKIFEAFYETEKVSFLWKAAPTPLNVRAEREKNEKIMLAELHITIPKWKGRLEVKKD